MKVGVPKEVRRGERRVAATPETVGRLVKLGFEVLVEKDAGAAASFRDSDYVAQGAAITAVTGSFIIGAIVTPDVTRFMRSGRDVLGNGCRAVAFTLPLSMGAIGRPSYSSTPPRCSTQARRVRARPLLTSITTEESV